jgi:hypothetical protein
MFALTRVSFYTLSRKLKRKTYLFTFMDAGTMSYKSGVGKLIQRHAGL